MPTNTPDILRNGDPVATNPEPEWIEESSWTFGRVDTVGAYTSNYWRQRAAKVTRHPIGFTTERTEQ